MNFATLKQLLRKSHSKIVYLVLDGLGGLPGEQNGLTELETASTVHMDKLAQQGVCGLHQPIGPGITPGSGPAHLSLFGYDPLYYQVGRGVLAALGINFDLRQNDLVARGNFCTIDNQGRVTDRRAGRIPTEKNKELCALLSREIDIPGIQVFVETVKDHRFLLALRGQEFSEAIHDTDPQQTGVKPLAPKALKPEAESTIPVLEEFIKQTREILKNQDTANMGLLRGFSILPQWPTMPEVFGLNPAAIAAYPMYKGVARLIGMQVLDCGEKIEDELKALKNNWDNHDFFYLHIKETDSAGEDGDFERKVEIIEKVDCLIPDIQDCEPDVIIITGDHSTPAVLSSHSWHPVPLLIWSKFCRPDNVLQFGENACLTGALGSCLPAVNIMPIALANALRLDKYGA